MRQAYARIHAHHTTHEALQDAPIWIGYDSNFVRGSLHMNLEDAMKLQGELAQAIQETRAYEAALANVRRAA